MELLLFDFDDEPAPKPHQTSEKSRRDEGKKEEGKIIKEEKAVKNTYSLSLKSTVKDVPFFTDGKKLFCFSGKDFESIRLDCEILDMECIVTFLNEKIIFPFTQWRDIPELKNEKEEIYRQMILF